MYLFNFVRFSSFFYDLLNLFLFVGDSDYLLF